jgi:glycine C-acetyltransferase
MKKGAYWLKDNLQELKKSGLFNQIPVIESPIQSRIKINGHLVLNFCSNNYLGLANHPRLKKAACLAIKKYGVGPAAVRTIAGTTVLHAKLDRALAEFKKAEAVISFQSGFAANLGTIPVLVGRDDFIFSDELNHASIIDGCRLSGATVIKYEHLNFKDLENKIKKISLSSKKLIVTDGVFSMDGDIAPLPEIYKIGQKYQAILLVDDAHGEGVLGQAGRGIVDHFHLHQKVDLEIGTMSKAFGVVGGFAAGKKEIIDWLSQRARPFLFSSAMTIPDVAACLEAIKILRSSDKLVKKLWQNANFLKNGLKQAGFDIGSSQTPIIPLMLGDVVLAKSFSQELFTHGVFAKAIGFPTVPQGKARIRIMNSAGHSTQDLKKALSIFIKIGKKIKVI